MNAENADSIGRQRDAVANALFEKFVVRSDVYAEQLRGGGYVKVERPMTVETLKAHLRGEVTVGAYQLGVDSRVKWLCFDLDPERLSDPEEAARRVIGVCLERVKGEDGAERPRVWRSSLLLEASRYPDPSFHVWILFLVPVPAKFARWLGLRILELAGLSPRDVEVFPKQEGLNEAEPYGNLVKLPLGLHRVERKWSCFLSLETFKPLPRGVLDEVVGLSFAEADIERILNMKWQAKLDGGLAPVGAPTHPTPLTPPTPLKQQERELCVNFLEKLWVPGYRNQVEMAFLGWCIKNGVPYKDARWIIEEVVRRRNDEEASERLRLVDYHYSSRIHLGRRLKGLSGLREAVFGGLMK